METLGQPAWFGQYRLTSRLATGGMAEVYVGRHITPEGKFGPMVAVKRLLPHLVKDSQIVRMFLNEARITAQINHPNVVHIIELGNAQNEPFIAMELLEGHTFAELRERAAEEGRRVPTGITLRVLSEACRGLDAAHKAVGEDGQPLRLVHRDFTPDNIHVGVSGQVKVIDFGVAKTSSWSSGTEPGTLKGKFFYMSPEMILARPVDHRADIFAAGVMLYEQLTGLRPFTGLSIDEVVMRIAEGKPKKPSAVNPAVPMLLESVCLRALAHDPDNRFQSLEEFIEAIETVGGEAEVASDAKVGEYVSLLFPVQLDGRRQTLRRARELDPSTPGVFPTPGQGLAPSPLTPAQGAQSLAAPAPAPAQLQVQAQVPPSGQFAKAKGRSPVVPALVALLVLLGGGGAWFALKGAGLSPDAALQAAAAETEPSGRARLFLSVARNPTSTEAQREQAGAGLLALKAFDDALLGAEEWLKLAPKSKSATLLEARAAIGLRKGKRAEAALEKLGALDPADSEPDALLAGLRETQGDAPGALEAWTRAARKRPAAVEFAERQGYWLSQAGNLDEAATVLQGALAKRYSPEAAAELGFVRFRQNKRDEALGLLRKAANKAPQLFVAQYYLGAVLYQAGDVKGARTAYLAADALAGDDPRALVALCEVDAQQQASELADTKARLTARFADKAAALIARCAP